MTEKIQFIFNDGGRQEAGYKGKTGDCVTRAISIVTGISYQEVYDKLKNLNSEYVKSHRNKVAKRISLGRGLRGTTPRNGVHKEVYHNYLLSLGMKWHSTMQIGSGCKTHLNTDELPKGKLIVRVSKHLTSVIDGVINDTYDCSREGKRCVYGYYYFEK